MGNKNLLHHAKGLIFIFIVANSMIFTGCTTAKDNAGNKAIEYVAQNYPDEKYEKIKTIFQIDGDLYETRFKSTTDERFTFSVFEGKKMYDNYYTLLIEYKNKEIIYDQMKDLLEYDDFYVSFNDFDEDVPALKEIAKDISTADISVGVRYTDEVIKENVAEYASKITKEIFDHIENANSVFFIKYKKLELEMYVEIARKDIKKNASVEDIKAYILKEDLVKKLTE